MKRIDVRVRHRSVNLIYAQNLLHELVFMKKPNLKTCLRAGFVMYYGFCVYGFRNKSQKLHMHRMTKKTYDVSIPRMNEAAQ